MGVAFRNSVLGIIAAALLPGLAPLAVAAQEPPAPAPPPGTQVTNLDANGMDPLAQRLTPKERSERITTRTYSDAQWQAFETAVAAALQACERKDWRACVTAGDAFLSGEGAWPVPPIADILYSEACEAGYGQGCSALARMNDTEYSWPVDKPALFEKGCERGDLDACATFAEILTDTAPDDPAVIARAAAIIARACAAGGAEACVAVSTDLLETGRQEDTDRAYELLDAACRKSSVAACRWLAEAYAEEPDADQPLANLYLDLACTNRGENECQQIGENALRGIGMAPDRDLALAYFDKLCALNHRACEPAQTMRAIPPLRAACTAGDGAACARLGRELAVDSPEADKAQARRLLEAGCAAGFGDACADLVEIGLFSDRPLMPDELALVETGCAAGSQRACFRLASALSVMEGHNPGPEAERAAALFAALCDAAFPGACAAESGMAAVVPTARLAAADDSFLPPLTLGPPPPANDPDYSDVMGCFTAGVPFRGRLYTWKNCPRVEKGLGSTRTHPGQAPWQALIWRPETFRGQKLSAALRVVCGGSLIAQGWVLTAAHCLTDNGKNIKTAGHRIRLGVFNPRLDEGISYPILEVIPHPQYSQTEDFVFDIALVRFDPRQGLRGSVGQAGSLRSPIRAIGLDPLPVGTRRITDGMPVYAYGWGWTDEAESTSTDYLQVVKMGLATEAACTAVTGFRGAKANAALCAGGRQRQQTCYGDSGGPLVFYGDGGSRPVLIGVISAGKKCGTTGRLSQYTRVATVRRWIEERMRAAP